MYFMTYKLHSTKMLFSWFLQLVRYYTALGMYIMCLQVFYKALAYFRNAVFDLITAFYLQKKFNVKNGSLVQSNYNTKKYICASQTFIFYKRALFMYSHFWNNIIYFSNDRKKPNIWTLDSWLLSTAFNDAECKFKV